MQERKHKAFKRCATAITNLSTFEVSVTLDLLNGQLNAFNGPDCYVFSTGMFLFKPVSVCEGQSLGFAGVVSVAKSASINMMRVSSGDFIFFSTASNPVNAGRVLGHVQCTANGFFMILRSYRWRAADDAWESSVGPACLVPSGRLLSTAIWCTMDTAIKLIRPFQLYA